MKVLFLDINGVIDCPRTASAYSYDFGYGHTEQYDEVALRLLRRICTDGDVKVVISSTWRYNERLYHRMGELFGLPVIDRTSVDSYLERGRGDEIQEWLDEHPEVTQYAIIDDKVFDMHPHQMPFVVQTHRMNGLQFAEYLQLRNIFGLSEDWRNR